MTEKSSIVIKNLSNVTIPEIHKAWTDAFSDYVVPVNLSVEKLTYMLDRRGCDLNISFGAFDNGELVGFILNGIGQWNEKMTAYDTGTGLVKKYRRRGIATKLFDESLPLLREKNIKQYLLEVIQTNNSAIDLYRKKGFEVTREFNCYVVSRKDIQIQETTLNSEFPIQKINTPDWDLFSTFWDFPPSWQNSIDSIKRKLDHFTILGMSDKGKIIGYGIIENPTGDIPQIAIESSFRRKGLATTLIKNLIEHSKSDEIRIINTDSANTPFERFTDSINISSDLGQYEMVLEL
jgi:ribosomal protein S18 acetylase RimI-like enzyme